MDRYHIHHSIGEGAFGKVYLANLKKTNHNHENDDGKRAIKQITSNKRFTWDDMVGMRELQSIIQIPYHKNIVQVYEIHREITGIVSFVFEYMSHGTLLELMERRMNDTQKLTRYMSHKEEVQPIVHQILLGVQHLHDNGIHHRDLKPENILLSIDPHHSTDTNSTTPMICKIADFSLARHDDELLYNNGRPPTSYISTRWYRAPELLLHSKKYTKSIDIWAIGCIVSELYTYQPLFPGRDEIHQLHLIFTALGTPNMVQWKEGIMLLNKLNIKSWELDTSSSSSSSSSNINSLDFIRSVVQKNELLFKSDDMTVVVDFLATLLVLDPLNRCTATKALEHKYFNSTRTASDDTSSGRIGISSGTPKSNPYHTRSSHHQAVVSPLPNNIHNNYDCIGSQQIHGKSKKNNLKNSSNKRTYSMAFKEAPIPTTAANTKCMWNPYLPNKK